MPKPRYLLYDSDRTDPDTAPASGAVSGSLKHNRGTRLPRCGQIFGNNSTTVDFDWVYGRTEKFHKFVGVAPRSHLFRQLNLQVTLDAQRFFGWPGATVFLYGLGIAGAHPSTFVGDAQGVSNIEAPAKWKIEEAWIQQNLFGNRCSMLGRRYDLNSHLYWLQ